MARIARQYPTILVLAAVSLLAACGQDTPELELTPVSMFSVSAEPKEEVFAYTLHGGLSLAWLRYRLFGDGRLVREVVTGSPERVITTREVRLSVEDVYALMGSTVGSGLAELTHEKIRAVVGLRSLVKDASTVALRMRFERYQRAGKEALTPFEPRIVMEEPIRVAEKFPSFREAHALVELSEMLEELFGQTGTEAMMEAAQGSPP